MLAVDELSSYIAELIINKEKNDDDESGTIYGALLKTQAEYQFPPGDGSPFPEEAYSATAAFAEHLIDRLTKESILMVTKTLMQVDALGDAVTEKQIKKLKDNATRSAAGLMHVVCVVKASLTMVDWTYVAERVIEAGHKRATGETSSDDG
jgi:hypothetical protein